MRHACASCDRYINTCMINDTLHIDIPEGSRKASAGL